MSDLNEADRAKQKTKYKEKQKNKKTKKTKKITPANQPPNRKPFRVSGTKRTALSVCLYYDVCDPIKLSRQADSSLKVCKFL